MAAWLAVLALLASACGHGDVDAPQPERQLAPRVEPAQEPEHPVTTEAAPVPEPREPGALEPAEPDPQVAATVPDPLDSLAGEVAGASDGLEPADAGLDELASDPVLQWTEFDPGIGEAQLASVGDGSVLARLRDDSGVSYRVTHNGTDWVQAPLPEGIEPNIVNIAGDLWLVTGRRIDNRPPGIPRTLEHVFVSADRGATWVEVPVDSAPPVAHSVDQHLDLSTALASDGNIVVSAEIYSFLDIEALLAGRGLISESQTAIGHGFLDGSLIADVFSDPEVVEGIRNRTLSEVPLDPDGPVEFTAEELDLSADQQRLLSRPLRYAHNWGVRIYAGDASGLTLTAEYEGHVAAGFASPDGFLLRVERPYGLDPRYLLVASQDGRTWSERSLDADGEQVTGAAAAGPCPTIWRTNLNAGYSRIETLCHDGSSTRDVILQGVMLDRFGPGLSAGPAGFAAVVRPAEVTGASDRPQGDVWVGWSADGVDWEWQDVFDVFDVQPDHDIALAVGSDFLLARTETRDLTTGDRRPRWFMAKVPSG